MEKETWLDKEIGYQFTTEERTITEEEINIYNALVGATETIFVDDNAARSLHLEYKGKIVPGVFLLTMFAGLDLSVGLAADVPLVGMNDVKFVSPAYSGDNIKLVGELVSKKATSKGHVLVTWRWMLTNQDNALVATGTNLELFP